jgi:hypothetical protein
MPLVRDLTGLPILRVLSLYDASAFEFTKDRGVIDCYPYDKSRRVNHDLLGSGLMVTRYLTDSSLTAA